jgi:hypothetical protein
VGIKHCIGTVKKDCSEDAKAFAGLELFMISGFKDNYLIVLGPLELDQIEKFYKASYDSGMKEMISDDYEYCVWYLAGPECEFSCSIDKGDLEKIRAATQEDANKYDKNFDEFKKIHKFDEREQAMKEQEEMEQIAIEEFKKADKVDFSIRVRDGSEYKLRVIMYKGFAIHDSIDSVNAEESAYKSITVAEGKHKGIKLLSCNITEYEECIDEIREAIGDKQLEESDLAKLKVIVNKY